MVKKLVASLHADARILTCDQGSAPLDAILDTGLFDEEKAAQNPLWPKEVYGYAKHVPETEKYGIESFVYRARRLFDPALFHAFLTDDGLDAGVRAKGHFRLATRPDGVGELGVAGAQTMTSRMGRLAGQHSQEPVARKRSLRQVRHAAMGPDLGLPAAGVGVHRHRHGRGPHSHPARCLPASGRHFRPRTVARSARSVPCLGRAGDGGSRVSITTLDRTRAAWIADQDAAVLGRIHDNHVHLALWQRPRPRDLDWLDTLDFDEIDDVQETLPVDRLASTLPAALVEAGYPKGPHMALGHEITALARSYVRIMHADSIRMRLEIVETDACRKFQARLLMPLTEPGTQWIEAEASSDAPINPLRAGDVGLFKGRVWADSGNPASFAADLRNGRDAPSPCARPAIPGALCQKPGSRIAMTTPLSLRNYKEWKHCITQLCRIPLTLPYVEARLAALQDAARSDWTTSWLHDRPRTWFSR